MSQVLEKLHSITSKTLSQLNYRFLYLGISLVLYVLTKEHIIYVILLIIYLYFLFNYHRFILKASLVLLIIYQGRTLLYHKEVEVEENYEVTVISDITSNYSTSFVGKIDNTLVKVYLKSIIDLKPGDKYIIKGELTTPRSSTIPNGFDYKDYLLSRNIHYQLNAESYYYKDTSFHLNRIPMFIKEYIENNFTKSNAYLKTFILADKSSFDTSFLQDITYLGISHLFAVSGLHIGLLVVILEKLTKKNTKLITIFLLTYIFITSFSPSVVRAGLMYIIYKFIKYKKLSYSTLDVLSFIFILYLLISPYGYKNIGFVLSFTVTVSILLTNYIIKDKPLITQLQVITLISFISTLPIIINLNYQINLLSLLINVIMILYMSYIILPLSYLIFFLPILDSLYGKVISLFESVISLFSNIDFYTITISFTNQLLVIIYYILIYLLITNYLNKKKRNVFISLLILLFFITLNTNKFSITKEVVILDIYGDAILIKDHFDQCNILIDTGVEDNYNTVINYLKSRNIKRLDMVIISHYDLDHAGEFDDVYDAFLVKQVIDYNTTLDKVNCGSFYLEFFKDTNLKSENNKSLITRITINQDTYLFTGDIEKDREQEILSLNLQADYLKVPHHGSITSSTKEFIDMVNPREVFVTSYYKNTHSHPSPYVITRYEERNIIVNRIDIDGTIIIRYYPFIKHKKTTPPS